MNDDDRDPRIKHGKSFLNKILNELFPKDYTCDICGTETFGSNFCDDCYKKVKFNDGKVCPICGRKTYRPEICMECKNKPPLFKKAVSAFLYEDGVTVLISKFKNGKKNLKEYFADNIAKRMTDFPKADRIVYVPLSKKSIYRRGYNQGRMLAMALAKRIRTPVVLGAIKRVKGGRVQKGLSRPERVENVKGAFKVRRRAEIKGRNVLLVDDVMTTGSTANEITRILLKAGATAVFVATAASVEYLSPEKQAEKTNKK